MIQAPCKDCQERHMNCHSSCQKYIDFRKQRDLANDSRRKDVELRAFDISRARKYKTRKSK